MPSPVSSQKQTHPIPSDSSGLQPQSASMGKWQVTHRNGVTIAGADQRSSGFSGTGLNSRTIKPITAPVGLSLADQSNLSTLNQLQPKQICSGIQGISTLNELHALSALLQKTVHKNSSLVTQALTLKESEISTQK